MRVVCVGVMFASCSCVMLIVCDVDAVCDVDVSSYPSIPPPSFTPEAAAEIGIGFCRASAKRFREIFMRGIFMECPVIGVRVVLTGGMVHEVDSSETAFSSCVDEIIEKFCTSAVQVVREPWMTVEVSAPNATMEAVNMLIGEKGIEPEEVLQQGDTTVTVGVVPMRRMTGFIAELRRATSGVGEFSMEYRDDRDMMPHDAAAVIETRTQALATRRAAVAAAVAKK